MIEATRSIDIEAPIGAVWDYIKDISRWAILFPGCRECVVIDANNSRWVLKVGAGGLVRTVHVLVCVDSWAGPGRVDFSFQLEGDPVTGSGSYLAEERGPALTVIALAVRVQGSGAMAPMWEAVSKPLLPILAKSFAAKLKAEIEKSKDGSLPSPISEETAS
jgi:carbon monoxide dehydrogenase subunit G